MVLGVLFLASGLAAVKELRLAVWGTETEAKVKEIYEAPRVGRWSWLRGADHRVIFTFRDESGKRQEGSFSIDPDDAASWQGKSFPVIFVPGAPEVHREGEKGFRWAPVAIFVALGAFFGWSLRRFLKPAT